MKGGIIPPPAREREWVSCDKGSQLVAERVETLKARIDLLQCQLELLKHKVDTLVATLEFDL